MKDAINVKWTGNMAFEAQIKEHRFIVDAKPDVGGNDLGPRPKSLLMVSLAGCTGMDVVSILKKMKVEFDSFNVRVVATLADEHPKSYTDMHLIYEFSGHDLPLEKIRHAIELSQDKYCGVSNTLKKALNISYEINIAEQ